jgi:hypothetical protein
MSTNKNSLVRLTGHVQPTDLFQHLLSSLAEQKQRLVEAGVPEAVFSVVDLTEPEKQRVDAYTILFYVPDGAYGQGDPTSALEFYIQMSGKEPTVHRWFEPSETELRLHQRCERYTEGVHRVVVNLIANWDPENGRSMWQVFAQNSEPLTGAEALAAYALSSPKLIQCQDGERLPYCDTGIERQLDGEWSDAVYFTWNRNNREVYLDSVRVGHVSHDWSTPVVSRES